MVVLGRRSAAAVSEAKEMRWPVDLRAILILSTHCQKQEEIDRFEYTYSDGAS